GRRARRRSGRALSSSAWLRSLRRSSAEQSLRRPFLRSLALLGGLGLFLCGRLGWLLDSLRLFGCSRLLSGSLLCGLRPVPCGLGNRLLLGRSLLLGSRSLSAHLIRPRARKRLVR